jgi:beta-lactamase class A
MHRDRQRVRQPYVDQKPKPRNRAKRGLILVLLVAAVAGIWTQRQSFWQMHAKAQDVNLAVAALAKKPAAIDQVALASHINQVINGSSLEIGVSIIDLTDNQRYDYGLGDTEYIAASTTKILSACLFLHDVELGQANLSQPLGDSTAQAEMQKMIVISDDTAWEDFNDLLGHPALETYAQNLGMNSYDPDDNFITSDDLALLLSSLYQGKLLDKQHTNLLLSYMAQADYAQYIGGVIPKGVKFYHKIGFLDDRLMDAAIIDNGKHPYVLVVFTKDPSGSYNDTEGLQVFHSITDATLTAFAV